MYGYAWSLVFSCSLSVCWWVWQCICGKSPIYACHVLWFVAVHGMTWKNWCHEVGADATPQRSSVVKEFLYLLVARQNSLKTDERWGVEQMPELWEVAWLVDCGVREFRNENAKGIGAVAHISVVWQDSFLLYRQWISFMYIVYL
jgi:hypothetical protein